MLGFLTNSCRIQASRYSRSCLVFPVVASFSLRFPFYEDSILWVSLPKANSLYQIKTKAFVKVPLRTDGSFLRHYAYNLHSHLIQLGFNSKCLFWVGNITQFNSTVCLKTKRLCCLFVDLPSVSDHHWLCPDPISLTPGPESV